MEPRRAIVYISIVPSHTISYRCSISSTYLSLTRENAHLKENDLSDRVDLMRLDASRRIGASRKAQLGQYLTSASVARFMAGMLHGSVPEIRLLDPGAGVGSLFAACVEELCRRPERPKRIIVTAFEIDEFLKNYLIETLQLCRIECERFGIEFEGEIIQGDFLGLEGYELVITGGSDKDGFPMRKDVEGIVRKKIITSGGVGFDPQVNGLRRRKMIRGNTIAADVAQINCKVSKKGAKLLDEILGKKEATEAKPNESPKEEVKEANPETKHEEEKK